MLASGGAWQLGEPAIEPGGAAALASVLIRREEMRGKAVAVVASGGNADLETLQRALATTDFDFA